MRRGVALAVVAAGCWRGAPAPVQPLTNSAAETAPDPLVMTRRGIGPVDEHTDASEQALRRLFPKLRVVTTDLGGDAGVVFDVFDGTHKLLYVVPDDADDDFEGEEPRRYAGTVFAVFAVSPRIRVESRSWRAGTSLEDAAGLEVCECWGGGEVTACYAKGAHLRVIFEEPCADAEREGAAAMVGRPIARVMWKRVAD